MIDVDSVACRLIVGSLEWHNGHYEGINVGDVYDDKVVNANYDVATVSYGKNFLLRPVTLKGVLVGTPEYEQAYRFALYQALIIDQYMTVSPNFLMKTGFNYEFKSKMITFHREKFITDLDVKSPDAQQGKVDFIVDVLEIPNIEKN